jgi:hypothetical protein
MNISYNINDQSAALEHRIPEPKPKKLWIGA